MKVNSNTPASVLKSRSYWENRALNYPLPFEKKTIELTDQIISIAEKRGISFQNSRIFDIGCGTGAISLATAQRGARVTALDISENMLKKLAEEASHVGIMEVETIRASWKEIDPAALISAGKFDIVISSLSTAIEKEEDILKMESCSKQWCVCIAAGYIKRSEQCGKILQKFGLPLSPRPDIRSIHDKLSIMGRHFYYDLFTVITEDKNTISKIIDDIAKRIEREGKIPDLADISSAVFSLYLSSGQNDSIECKRWSDIGILIWRVDGKKL